MQRSNARVRHITVERVDAQAADRRPALGAEDGNDKQYRILRSSSSSSVTLLPISDWLKSWITDARHACQSTSPSFPLPIKQPYLHYAALPPPSTSECRCGIFETTNRFDTAILSSASRKLRRGRRDARVSISKLTA